MNFKNDKTTKSCNDWIKYPFENAHPLKDKRFYEFMYCLCKFEERIEDEDSFLSLIKIDGCKRSEEELKEAFCKHKTIYDFYEYVNSIME